VVYRTWVRALWSTQSKPYKAVGSSSSWVIHQPRAQTSVSTACSLPQRVGTPITMPSWAEAPHCLNFSAGPCPKPPPPQLSLVVKTHSHTARG
jgi:hypothetical protein